MDKKGALLSPKVFLRYFLVQTLSQGLPMGWLDVLLCKIGGFKLQKWPSYGNFSEFRSKNSVFGHYDTPKTPYGVDRLKSAP